MTEKEDALQAVGESSRYPMASRRKVVVVGDSFRS